MDADLPSRSDPGASPRERAAVVLGLAMAAAVGPGPAASEAARPAGSAVVRAGQRAAVTGAARALSQHIEPAPRCPDPLEVLVERGFARDRGLTLGDPVDVRAAAHAPPCPAEVAGVYRPRPDPARLAGERPRVLFHLPDLARLSGRDREVDRFSVRLHRGADADSVRTDLAALLPGTRVVSSVRLAEESSTTFRVVQRFHRAIALVTLVAGAIFLACIMILKVQERRTEVAALRLAGVSRRTLLGWITAEAALVSVLGGALGVWLGHLASHTINRVYRGIYDTSLTFSLVTGETVRGVLVLAVVLGLGAGLAAGLHLLSLDPLEEVGR